MFCRRHRRTREILPVNGARRPSTLKLPAAFKFSGDGRHNGSGGIGSQRGESDGGSGGTAHRLGCTPVLGLRCAAAARRWRRLAAGRPARGPETETWSRDSGPSRTAGGAVELQVWLRDSEGRLPVRGAGD